MIDPTKLACLTTATHAEGDHPHFVTSCARNGWPPFFPVGWIGRRVMDPHPMVERVRNLARHVLGLREVGGFTHFLHLDSWDVLCAGSPERFCFLADALFHKPVVFSAERGCFPRADWADRYPPVFHGEHRFLNAGAFFAEIHAFCDLIERYDLATHTGSIDQEVYTRMFLENPEEIELDHGSSLFLNLHAVPQEEAIASMEGGITYLPTQQNPVFIHGNSGENGHQRFLEVLK